MGCCGAKLASADSLAIAGNRATPAIGMPPTNRGSKVILTDPLCLSGDGAALASAPIEQDAAYWEVRA
jgi:hypothetical protein